MSKRNYRANAQHAAAMIRRLSAVADRLAARGIEVFSLDWSCMGWSLIVGWNDIAVKFDSSTLEGDVTVEESPVRESTFPNEWVETQRKVLGRGKQKKIMEFVEKYLEDRFG